MTVIGLGGKLRAGKDAVADRLVERHGYVKIGMSDALHEAMLALDPIINAASADYPDRILLVRYSDAIEDLGYTEAKKIPEVRRLLQQLGTEVGRKMIGEDTWTNIVRRRIDELEEKGIPVVLTGLRFPNEIAVIDERYGLGAITIWVERPGIEAPTTGTAAHASENSVTVEDFDFVLENDSTLDQLYAKVDTIAAEVNTL
ncbi:deoxynucleotide monophosphate kinase family protein [Microbacterium sp. T32]|uniref:deoxynucleotide monophosphate kinase family protein n=1 Tax=Microbacterium sp. T32 TaxID=1776083 RepID=UPI0007AB86C7|nr:hypothetical protein [Microbacterium sp. T32]KZE41367.1 hypothetical protein AVW09_01925 [Microbacterium sp. T32]